MVVVFTTIMTQTTNDNKYNGWTNYETWNVKLWPDNNEGSYTAWNMEAKERLENAIPEYPELSTVRQQAIIDLAGMLKEYHEEKADHLVTITGVFADLISAALSSVDWYEIAEAYIEDNEE